MNLNNQKEFVVNKILSVNSPTKNRTFSQLTTIDTISNQTLLVSKDFQENHNTSLSRTPRQKPYEQQVNRGQQHEKQTHPYNVTTHSHHPFIHRRSPSIFRFHPWYKEDVFYSDDYSQQQLLEYESSNERELSVLLQDEIDQINQIEAFANMIREQQIQQEQLNHQESTTPPEELEAIQDQTEQLIQIDIVQQIKNGGTKRTQQRRTHSKRAMGRIKLYNPAIILKLTFSHNSSYEIYLSSNSHRSKYVTIIFTSVSPIQDGGWYSTANAVCDTVDDNVFLN
ncbi:unnamed protein product [Adineta ricciae]|uniref:Uncharacterized protein n=1 Tax=Adineta ricciae TaxID=249248 RepID=A0A815WSP4_ADIRI|nr:unnamed protein product [Adineta ricciae]CAF1658758.1 unnamed protein product [Adineta ricciae]